MTAKFSVIQADISLLAAEAIVNAANEPLVMGGGVDGAIRRKAGPGMETEIRAIGRCPTGEATITRGHALAAKFVIHTVAPIWSGEQAQRESDIRLLANCYGNSLALARANAIAEIAFPCLGTGIYGWPADLAAQTAFRAVCASVQKQDGIAHVIFCCFSPADLDRYGVLVWDHPAQSRPPS
ncbi:MAG TPA: macro domain-containing protein [Bryobacteraceae bacterium]|nr:macro domain-containing protein [Bryobacteraceae bacterium]